MGAVQVFRRRFQDEGDPKNAPIQRAYMKSSLTFYGVVSAQVRAAARDYCREHELDHRALIRDVSALFATTSFDLRSAGVAVLERHRKWVTPDDADWLIGLVRRASCWAHVDGLATKIVPHALTARPAAQLRLWARDELFWVRRTALLAPLDVLRSGGGDFALFCSLAEPMLEEREFFIRKAIGWVLREVSKKRPELVRSFVVSHGERMSGLTRREATKYLD